MLSTSTFFYGTLLHPEVLKRVIGNNGDHLKVAPAVLPDFTRHRVKGCDYPVIMPYASVKTLSSQQLGQNERSVRGTVVSGLTMEDIRLLDVFDDDHYVLQTVSVSPLAPFTSLVDAMQTLISPEVPSPEFNTFIEVQTYIWTDCLDRLMPDIWSFDVFVKEKLGRWVDHGSNTDSDYAIVDKQKLSNVLSESPVPQPSLDGKEPPEFGHGLLSQFCFHKDYVNLNHGSYGSLPRPVLEAVEAMSLEVESRPDKFIRRTYYPLLNTVRGRLGRLIGAETDEVVMVPNATHGINTILRNFVWNPEDVLVGTTTTYGAISRTLQYIHDLPPHPALSTLILTFPTTHAAILEQFIAHIRKIPRKPGQKVVAVIDAIGGYPGCVLPWEKMVTICKEENVWSVVDGAHSVGQQVDLNLGKIGPDFWVSNCHKWLFAKRACAVVYVPKRNQHIIKSAFPTSFGYASPDDPQSVHTPKPPNFVAQFEYTGTIDVVPFLSVNAAMDFRERLGGEKRINEYCHDLATQGGKLLAQRLQTSAMPDELTANIANVLLPLPIPHSLPVYQQERLRRRMEDKLLEEWDCFAAVFAHDGKWWTRCSAQVWNELCDFEHVAQAFSAICAELRNEQATEK